MWICRPLFEFLNAWFALRCQFGVLLPSFIDFISKALPNSLQLPLWHVVILFLLSTDHVHFHIFSSELRIVCYVLIFCNSISLPFHTLLLLCWWCLVVVLVTYAVIWIGISCIILAGLYWTYCKSPILLVTPAEILLN